MCFSLRSRSRVNEPPSLCLPGSRKLLTHNEEEVTARCRDENERDNQNSGMTSESSKFNVFENGGEHSSFCL